jgi:UDP-N-acetylmuramyl pentapeptide synthase
VFGGAAREAALGLPLVGEHNAGNAALAWAAAQAMGRRMGRVGGAQGKVELVSLALPSGRLGFREGTGAFAGVQVLDDSYNANPGSMRAGLRVLAELAQRSGGRAIAVLGDMLELGAEAEALHREVGRCAGELGVWGLVAFGAWSQALAEGCREARGQGWALATDGGGDEAVEQAVARLREQARAGDTILIKGSRGARMERIVHRLTTQER